MYACDSATHAMESDFANSRVAQDRHREFSERTLAATKDMPVSSNESGVRSITSALMKYLSPSVYIVSEVVLV